MFCPPAYVHIHEILDACKAAALVQIPYGKQRELAYSESRPERVIGVRSNSVLRIAQEQELLIAFIEKHKAAAHAYKLGSDPVRITPSILSTRKRKGFFILEANPEARPELTYVDLKTGKIDLAGTAERMTSWYDEKLYDSCADRRRGHFLIQKKAEADFGEIDGWTICFDRANSTWSVKAILELWKERRKKQGKSKAGAPNKIDAALEVYYALFPNGRGSTHWGVIHQQLADHGVDIGLSTLQKAVRQSEKAS